jgi:subtilisin family serine protease
MFLVAASATRAQELDQQVVLTDPSVRDAAVQSGPAYDPSSILVRFKDTARVSDKAAARALVRGAVKRRFHLVPGLEHIRIGNGMSVESAIKALERRPFVAYAEPNYSVHLAEAVDAPDDYWFTELWGLDNWGQASSFGAFASGTRDADIKVLQAWATASGNNVVVAILDTGIDYNHADLNPNMWINSDEFIEPPHYKDTDDDHNGFVDDIRGWDFYNDDNDPFDDNDHGTHVAGIIGAVRNNGIGTVGVSPNVKLMAVKFLGPDGNGDDALSIAALEYAVDNGARVSNHSYFLDLYSSYSSALHDAIVEAGNHGHLVVAAAGNDGLNVDGPFFNLFRRYPASYDPYDYPQLSPMLR